MNKQLPTLSVGELMLTGEARLQTGPFGTQLKASEYVPEGIPVINVRNVGFGEVRADDLEYISEAKAEQLHHHIIRAGDIVFGRKGAVERHALIKKEQDGWAQGSDCLRLRLNSPKVSSQYLSYYLRTQAHQDWMQALCSFGATMNSLNQDIVSRIRFPLPSPEQQRKVVAVLTAYDDLIANNQRRIALLESMAEEIYREWFVRMRFPGRSTQLGDSLEPAGWERKPLGHLTRLLKRGVSPDYDDKAQALVVNQKCIRNGQLSLTEARPHSTLVPDEKMLRYGDVLVNSTGVGTLGRAAVFDIDRDDLACDSHVTIARPKDVEVEGEYLAYTVQLLQPYFEAMASGSTGQAELNRDFISKTKVLIPPRELMVAFSKHAQPIRKQRRLLLEENGRLAATRDTLLPRLISGKLRVDQLHIQTPPSMRAETAQAV